MSSIQLSNMKLKNGTAPLVQGGTSNLSSGNQSITFPTPYTSVPAVTCNWTAPQNTSTKTAMVCFNVSTISTTGFTVYGTYINNTGGTNTAIAVMGADQFTWTAVGM